jgi:ketosteroid isomerase-like protein
MTTLEIGTKLVALVRAGKNPEAVETLYDPAIVSVEAGAPPGQSREATGIPACLAKGKAFRERFEVHGVTVEGPFPHDDRFAILLKYDLTPKTGPKFEMAEVAMYTVKNDKIVREEFFYAM